MGDYDCDGTKASSNHETSLTLIIARQGNYNHRVTKDIENFEVQAPHP